MGIGEPLGRDIILPRCCPIPFWYCQETIHWAFSIAESLANTLSASSKVILHTLGTFPSLCQHKRGDFLLIAMKQGLTLQKRKVERKAENFEKSSRRSIDYFRSIHFNFSQYQSRVTVLLITVWSSLTRSTVFIHSAYYLAGRYRPQKKSVNAGRAHW